MSTKELKADANALMDLEMMDTVVGGAGRNVCHPSCIKDCQPCCKQGCGHSGRNHERDRLKKKKIKRT